MIPKNLKREIEHIESRGCEIKNIAVDKTVYKEPLDLKYRVVEKPLGTFSFCINYLEDGKNKRSFLL